MAEDNYLNLSDEEMLEVDETIVTEVVEDEVLPEEPVEAPEEELEVEDEQVEEEETEDSLEEATEAPDTPFDDSELATEDEPVKDVKEEVEEEKVKDTPFNYEEEYKKVLAPLRANGKDIKLDTLDDLRNLASMGANYNKKMATLKPMLKMVKMLENNGLMDESKLSYLIDLDKKDPNAINKLVKDSGIDPLDVDTDKATEYQPTSYAVNDKEVELDGYLDDIRGTESFQRTIDIVSKEWDDSSKQVLLDEPGIIKVINDHVSSGIYDQITTEVERQKMLGHLSGTSALTAYKQVGDLLESKGAFAKATPLEEPVQPVKAKLVDTKLKDKRKAASATKSAPKSTKTKDDFDPLNMSDEDFEKSFNNELM